MVLWDLSNKINLIPLTDLSRAAPTVKQNIYFFTEKPKSNLLLQLGQQLSHQRSKGSRSEAFGEGFSR
jgi:hypothetical protein